VTSTPLSVTIIPDKELAIISTSVPSSGLLSLAVTFTEVLFVIETV
jgi:hypothetical protein